MVKRYSSNYVVNYFKNADFRRLCKKMYTKTDNCNVSAKFTSGIPRVRDLDLPPSLKRRTMLGGLLSLTLLPHLPEMRTVASETGWVLLKDDT